MDIWAWVENLHEELTDAGHERVADFLYSLPNLVCEDKIGQAQALFPEALAAAKSLKNPWMEVFFRHWQMRLRLGALAEGETALPEAISLLDFAHSEACRECPQSVCTTQDVAACYAYVDGPGWAPERKAVCLETLERITPHWNCYSCITSEYADALGDEGKPGEALAYMTKALEEVAKVGKDEARNRHHQRIGFIVDMGDPQAALNELDALEKRRFDLDDESDQREGRLLRARIMAHLGRWNEAWELLSDWDDKLPPNDYMDWTEIAALIMQNCPDRNNWQMGGALRDAMAYMSRVQAHRRVFDIGERHVRLALARGAFFTARQALETMRSHLPRLRAPLGADALLEDLERAAGAAQAVALPVPAPELEEYLRKQEQRDPEQEIDMLLRALGDAPDNTGLLLLANSALQALGARDKAAALLWAFVERAPEQAEDIIVELISLIPAEDGEGLDKLAGIMDRHLPFLGLWCRAHLAFRAQDWAGVGEQLEKFIAERPESMGARKFWAEAAMRGGDFATAARLRKELVELVQKHDEDPGNDRWDLLVAASAAQDWGTVRQTCMDMGFDVEPGDEVLDDPGAWVRIRYHEGGEYTDHMAVRTGPVTARILTVARPADPQHVKDWVVFEPTPLEPEPEDPEEKEYFTTPYNYLHTIKAGNYTSWMLDGVDPDMEEWQPFRDAMEERGYALWVRSSSEYRVTDPGNPDGLDNDDEPWGLPGIFLALGIPPGVSTAEADSLLAKLTKDWKHPLSWLDLAKDAGVDTSRHIAVIERYGLE